MLRLTTSLCERIGLLVCLLLAIALVACSAPMKVERVDLHTASDDINRTALSSDRLSETTRAVLRRAAPQDGPLETRDDGGVEYKSARIDGVDSDLMIEHQNHSAQSNPLTVREVRRILIEQLARPSL